MKQVDARLYDPWLRQNDAAYRMAQRKGKGQKVEGITRHESFYLFTFTFVDFYRNKIY